MERAMTHKIYGAFIASLGVAALLFGANETSARPAAAPGAAPAAGFARPHPMFRPPGANAFRQHHRNGGVGTFWPGTGGFYASRDYAAHRKLPERRDEWKEHSIIGFADRESNAHLARWSDFITRQGSLVMRCSSQGDMLAAARAGLGITALSCFVAAAYPDLVRVAPQKLVSVADLWLLAHPDLVELPALRAVISFVTACAREDRVKLRG